MSKKTKTSKKAQDLSEEEKKQNVNMVVNDVNIILKKKKKGRYGHKQCKNLPEKEKQRLVENRKNYSKIWKK